MRLRFVAAMIRRELRAARRRFGLYAGCMAIGIAVVVGLHSLRETVEEAVDLESRQLLGADLRLESRNPFGSEMDAALRELAEAPGAVVTTATRLGSMALAESSGRSRLVDLLAIDGEYPLYGEVWTEPVGLWERFGTSPGTIFVDTSLLVQLDVVIGDTLRIGGREFRIVAAVKKAPGSSGMRAEIAPRVFLSGSDLATTDLIQEGSLAEFIHYYRLPGDGAVTWGDRHENLLANERVRVETVQSYQEELSDAFGSLTRYLGLVGLAALVLGSIGVAAGVRVFVREKLETVALLRSIGVSPREVIVVYAGLAAALGLFSGVLGILLCLPLLAILPGLLEGLLPVEVGIRLGPAAIATGLALSVWATLLCAVGPVFDLAHVSPLSALRRDFGQEGQGSILGRLVSLTLVAASLVLVSIWQANDLRVGLSFAPGLFATVAVLAGAATVLTRLLRRFPPKFFGYAVRQGIANLFRPRNHTLSTIIAIGFALFIVATIHGVARNVLDQLSVDSRPDRPNFILFDVQRDQLAGVRTLLADRGAAVVDEAPLISARIAGVGGRARSDWLADEALSKSKRWGLQREYRLTYSEILRDTETIVAGTWWSPGAVTVDDVPYPVSLESDLAQSLGVTVGDAVTWRIQGVEVETKIASLREVDWGKMATNFFVVFPSAALESAPQSSVLLAYLEAEKDRAEVQRDLVGGFPNVAALDATLILRSLDSMMEQISVAVRLLFLFTLGTGAAILVAATVAARSERAHEAGLLRVLGASREVLRRIAVTEAIVLAALAAFVGAGLAVVASWWVVEFSFELPFAPPWLDWLALAGATFAVTTLAGGIGGFGGGQRSAGEALRHD